jgi:hypothetical protein
MRKWVKTFKPEFAQMVVDGSKLTTIRPWPKDGKIPVNGDMLDARMWSGKAYRSSQLKLGMYKIISANAFEIRKSNFVMTHDIILSDETLAYIAKCDGFNSWDRMFTWFIQNYKLPFFGVRIKWEPFNKATQAEKEIPSCLLS